MLADSGSTAATLVTTSLRARRIVPALDGSGTGKADGLDLLPIVFSGAEVGKGLLAPIFRAGVTLLRFRWIEPSMIYVMSSRRYKRFEIP